MYRVLATNGALTATELAAGRIVDRLTEAFKSGHGIGWHEHHPDMFPGCARFFKVGYLNHLVQEWIPALDGVETRLKTGIRVADVGCGVGYSTLIMAKAFPNSHFIGFDYHDESIAAAQGHARKAGLTNVTFEIGRADSYRGMYDFITVFDALHNMGDPAAASRHVFRSLASDGTWMIVEPYAGVASRKTSIRSAAPITRHPPCCVRPAHCRRKVAWGWARRRAKRACGQW